MLDDLIYPDRERIAREMRQEQRMPLSPMGAAVEAQQPLYPDTISPDQTSDNNPRARVPVFGRNNLVLNTAGQTSDEVMPLREEAPVSPIHEPELQPPNPPFHARTASSSRNSARSQHGEYLSPSSASFGRPSRRGVEDTIPETDTVGESTYNDDAQSSYSTTSSGWRR